MLCVQRKLFRLSDMCVNGIGELGSVIWFQVDYRPYDAFSTLQPLMIVPFEASSAAPTRKFE
jgi:hypothetical protein